MRIKEAAELAGISVRTLHHYDEIGLLVPERISESGYRVYSDENLETLQHILFFRELGFPLNQIRSIMASPEYDRTEALKTHHRLLVEKRNQLNEIIATVERTIEYSMGEIDMTNEDKFRGFDFNDDRYKEEARKLWGNEAVDETNHRIRKMEQNGAFSDEMHAIFLKLASLRNRPPASDEAQSAIREWHSCLNKVGRYSLDAIHGLGRMYTEDERFTQNIDQYGKGTAAFITSAVEIYVEKSRELEK